MHIFRPKADRTSSEKIPRDKQIVVAHSIKTLDIIYDVENEIEELRKLFPMSEQNIPDAILSSNGMDESFDLQKKSQNN